MEIALAFRPSHLSCYGLVFEKGPNFGTVDNSGSCSPLTRRPSGSCSSRPSSGWQRPRWKLTRFRTSLAMATSAGTTWSTGPTMLILASGWGAAWLSRRTARSHGLGHPTPAPDQEGSPVIGPERRAVNPGQSERDRDPDVTPTYGLNGWPIFCGAALALYVVGSNYFVRQRSGSSVTLWALLLLMATPLVLAMADYTGHFRMAAAWISAIRKIGLAGYNTKPLLPYPMSLVR